MLRRLMLLVTASYGLWIVWACMRTLQDASAAAVSSKNLALTIVIRQCGGGDLILPSCISRVRDVVASINEPSLWAALWRMRGFYAEFILVPPFWLGTMAGISAVTVCLCLISWRLVLGRRRNRVRARQEWRASRAPNWPYA
jgi:hypothetical protein